MSEEAPNPGLDGAPANSQDLTVFVSKQEGKEKERKRTTKLHGELQFIYVSTIIQSLSPSRNYWTICKTF